MCSFLFEQRNNIIMDEHTISSNSSSSNINTSINNFQGDLTDIVRARPGIVAGLASASSSSSNSHHHPHLDVVSGYEEDLLLHSMANDNNNNSSGGGAWQLFSSADPLMMNCFGDPFSHLRPDPLLHHHMAAAAPGLFGSPPNSSPTTATDLVNGGGVGFCSGVNGFIGPSHEEMNLMSSTNSSGGGGGGISGRPSCNIFSRMLQINPTSANSCSSTPTTAIASKLPCNSNTTTNTTSSSQGGDSPSPSPPPPSMAVASPRGINVNSSQQGGCLVENNSTGGLQISSPRNPGIKRRKSQAKKVVCIPAPAAANSRATGEVVPSDLWAWRKYGQKPIKGSPYPRGYYRCSSSKGCSARKQVERSRTDPNMLVITYTSEHNHPWPTQRNALAGSTRSQPSKNTPNSIKSAPLMSSHQLQKSTVSSPKEDSVHQLNNTKEMGMMMIHGQNDNNNAVVGGGGSTSSTTSASVKEENVDHEVHDYEHEIDEKVDQLDDSSCHDHQFNGDEVVGLFPYRPTMPGPNPSGASADQDFFADLEEIEADPLNLLFSQGFNSADHEHKGMLISKGLDPFNLFDWPGGGGGGGGDNNNNNNIK